MKKAFFRISLQNIRRHWKKSLITGTCICLGFTGIILLGGYMVRMERYLTTQGIYLNHVGHLALYKEGGLDRHLVEPSTHSFSPQEVELIKTALSQRKEVEHIGGFIHGQGLITNGCQSFPFQTWASEPQTQKYLREHPLVVSRIPLLTKLKYGRGFWEGEEGILITKRLAELLKKPLVAGENSENVSARDQIITDCLDPVSTSTLSSHSGIQLVGSSFDGGLAALDSVTLGHFTTGFALTEDSSILMPLTQAQEFFNTDQVTSLGVFLKTADQTSNLQTWLEHKLKALKLPVEIYRYDDSRVNPFYVGAMRFVYIMNLFFFIIVCGVVILSLLNAIQIAILERKAEIGTLLAVGYRREHVRKLFELEALMIAVISMGIAVILSYILATVVNSLGIPFDIVGNAEKLYLTLEVEWWYCFGLFVFFVLLVWGATSWICRVHLSVPLTRLLERGD